jgi:dipeptidyl aminopeptidase/acylaminoacyl peptidase
MGTPNGHHFNAVTKDVFFDVPNGVLPAIDKAIELGIADPTRLFVEGASGGGFATMAIIEQTNRFKAAIAGVGISSWMNGSFSSRGRYGEDVVWMNIGWMNDNIQDRPPKETMWSDFGLFMRNSPIIYADRIETPLLLQSADQDDNVPMSQSEEMFSAMVQLKKRAAFVRYWGEGHGLASPANIRDFWQRRLAWFDEWGDIARDSRGQMAFDGGQVKGRRGSPALKPADYTAFELFRKSGGN